MSDFIPKYIHYGSEHFDKKLFGPIKNTTYPWTKPEPCSGMWGSPLDSNKGWFDWCWGNNFRIEKLDKHFKFTLAPNSQVIIVADDYGLAFFEENDLLDTKADRYSISANDLVYIDFEKCLAEGIDAIQLYITPTTYWRMYGWDCDSILILNPDCVVEI